MKRRSFFATLFAPVVARFAPKRIVRTAIHRAPITGLRLDRIEWHKLGTGKKIGDTITVRMPPRFVVRHGEPFKPEVYDGSISL